MSDEKKIDVEIVNPKLVIENGNINLVADGVSQNGREVLTKRGQAKVEFLYANWSPENEE